MEQITGNSLGERILADAGMSHSRLRNVELALFGAAKAVARRNLLLWLLLASCWLTMRADSASGTVVRFTTTAGVVDVRLYDTATPNSVANFLNYSTTNRFDNTIFHRSIPGFIVQGGGFRITTDIFNAVDLPADPPVVNEYGISNLRGTIAYAKVGPPQGQPPTPTTINSATREWFFNLADNSSNLNNQNGGFTVFGRVVGAGMTVVDAIAAKPRVNAGSPFTDLPVNNLAKVQSQSNVFLDDAVNVTTVRTLNIPAGDYDFNGTVNAVDYQIWKDTFGSTTNAAADGNGNGRVDAADYSIWRNTFGQTLVPGGGSMELGGLPVPEPAAAVTTAIAALGCLIAFGRRRTAK